MTITRDQAAGGMTPQEYIDQIKVNKEPFVKIYEATEISRELRDGIDALNSRMQIVAFTADWCGDALSTTPAIMRLAESVDNLDIALFNRDEHLELADSFLPENRAGTVPIFVVYDEDWVEIARFIETANELVPEIDEMDEMISHELASEDESTSRRMRRGKRTEHRIAKASAWGNVILEAFCQTVKNGLALPSDKRPAIGGTKWPPGA